MILSRLLQAIAISLFGVISVAQAEPDYPTRPITMIIPFAPGGATDIVGRLAADYLSKELGQPVVPVNRAGAGGSIGASALAKADADGYTLGVATVSTHVVNPIVMQLDYDPHDALLPVIRVAAVPNVLAVNDTVPAKTMGEFIALLQKNPDQHSFASAGIGGINHIMCEMFMASSDTKMMHIPYKGSGPAMADVIGGRVDAICDQISSSQAHIQSGKLRALAVAAPERLASLPEVPTFEELGLPDVNSMAWYGIMTPKGTPQSIIDKVNTALNKALGSESMISALKATGSIPIGGTQQDFADIINDDSEKIGHVVKTRNISIQ